MYIHALFPMMCVFSQMLSKSKKPEMSVIGGCLRGLNSYLVNFSQSVAEGTCMYGVQR